MDVRLSDCLGTGLSRDLQNVRVIDDAKWVQSWACALEQAAGNTQWSSRSPFVEDDADVRMLVFDVRDEEKVPALVST